MSAAVHSSHACQPALTPLSGAAAQGTPASGPWKSLRLHTPVRQLWLPLYSGFVQTAKGADGREAAWLPSLAV